MSAAVAWDRAARDLEFACLDAANLARVLGALGLAREFSLARGNVPGWEPAYERLVPWRRRYRESGSIAARGWQSGAWPPEREAAMDAADDRERERIAERNRVRRDSECFVLSASPIAEARARRGGRAEVLAAYFTAMRAWCAKAPEKRGPAPRLDLSGTELPRELIFLDLQDFAWRDRSGAAHGDDLASLGAFVWGCGRGRATARLARAVGVEILTVAEHERQLRAVEALRVA